MDLNNLIGKKITHKKFGFGTIVEAVDAKFVNVAFADSTKKFKIDSLDLFFTFEDKDLEMLIKKENQKEREEQARRLKEQEEQAEEVRRLKEQEIIEMEKIAKRGKTFSKGLDIRDGVLVGMGTCNLASINIPDDVTSIGESVFTTGNHPLSQYYEFNNITIPDSVKSIGFHAFYGSQIDKLTIGKGVKDIDDYAFEYTKIKKVNYLGTIDEFLQITFDYYNNPIKWSGKLYIDNKLVEDIVLSKDTKLDDFSTLKQLRYIKSITVDTDNPYYKSVDGNLYTKDGKTLIKYASAKKDKSFVLPDTVEEIKDNAFDGAKYLTKITIPASVKIMGPEAFRHCSALEKVNYLGTIDEWAEINFGCAMENLVNTPTEFASLYINDKLVTDVVLTKATKVSRYAFKCCESIESVTIGSSVKAIEEEAFCCCTSLKSVTISDGLTYIGDSAFSNCSLLQDLKAIKH
jgi:hypothetical protein